MKRIIYTILMLVLNSLMLSAKILYTTRMDSIPITGDSVTLKLFEHRGSVQWQRSLDGETWRNLINENKDSVIIPTSIEALYRAEIMDDSCFVSCSDTTILLLELDVYPVKNPINISGLTITNINDSDYIYSYRITGPFELNEVDLLIDPNYPGDIRIVEEITKKSNVPLKIKADKRSLINKSFGVEDEEIIIRTAEGTLENIFSKASFELVPNELTNSKSLININSNIQNQIKSEKPNKTPQANSVFEFPNWLKAPIVWHDVIKIKDQVLYSNENTSVYLQDFDANIGLGLKCKMGFRPAITDAKTVIEWIKMKLFRIKGILDTFEIKTDVDKTGYDYRMNISAITSGKNVTFIDQEKTLKTLMNKSFLIPTPSGINIPLTVGLQLKSRVSGNLTSDFTVYLMDSMYYHYEYGYGWYENIGWKAIRNESSKNGHGALMKLPKSDYFNNNLSIEIYPHIYAGIIPKKINSHIEVYFDLAYDVSETTKVSTIENVEVDIVSKIIGRIGVELQVLFRKFTKKLETKIFESEENKLYHLPENIQVNTENNCDRKIFVYDSNKKGIKNINVYLNESIRKSDVNGFISLMENKDFKTSYLKNSNNVIIDSTRKAFNNEPICECNKIKTDVSISIGSGKIYATATGGVGALMYAIDKPENFTLEQFFDLTPGKHYLYVKDSRNCIAKDSIDPCKVLNLQLDVEIYNKDYIKLNASNGFPPYKYAVESDKVLNFTTGNVFKLKPDSFTYYVKDSLNCIASVNLCEKFNLKLQVIGYDNDSVKLRATGGIPPYSYSTNSGEFSQDSIFKKEFVYCSQSFDVKDLINCTAHASSQVSHQLEIEVSTSGRNIHVYVKNGNPPFTYRIGSENEITSSQPDMYFEFNPNTMVPGYTQSITVIDSWGCMAFGTGCFDDCDFYEKGVFEYGGRTYNTLKYAGKTWMTDNFRYMPNGVAFSTPDKGSEDAYQDGKPFFYAGTYGTLYNYFAANLVIPPGWRIINQSDYNQLINQLSNSCLSEVQRSDLYSCLNLVYHSGSFRNSVQNAIEQGSWEKGIYWWLDTQGNQYQWYLNSFILESDYFNKYWLSESEKSIHDGLYLRLVRDY